MAKNSYLRKLPVAFQALLGFALAAFGVVIMVYSGSWANNDFRFIILFLGLGVLYLVNAIPSLIEGISAMVQSDKDVCDIEADTNPVVEMTGMLEELGK